MNKVKQKLNNAKQFTIKWGKRASIGAAIAFLAWIATYAYWDEKLDQILPKQEKSEPKIAINWEALQATNKNIVKNPTTKYNARLIINYAKDSPVAWYDFLAIAAHESLLWDMDGDRGCSQGLFHINYCNNKDIARNEALNPLTALSWTEKKLIERGYKQNRFTAIGRHNGGNWVNKKYAFDVLQLADKLQQVSNKK